MATLNQAVLKLAHAFKAELKNELQDKGALVDKVQALEADNKALEAERAALLLKLQVRQCSGLCWLG